MMKRIFSLSALLLLILAAAPQPVTAVNLVQQIDTVCTDLQTRQQDIDAKLDSLVERVDLFNNEFQESYEEKRTETRKDIERVRTDSEAKRFEGYKELRANTQSDAQKLAVEVFVSSMEKAVRDRQSAYDKALDSFHTGLRLRQQSRYGNLKSATTQLSVRISEVVNSVQSGCSYGLKNAELRDEFIAGLKEARLAYTGTTNDKNSDQMKGLVGERQKAFETARSQFEKTVQDLTSELNARLGE